MADPFPHDLLRRIHSEKEIPRQVKRWIRAALPPVTVDYKGCAMQVHPSDNNTEFQIWRMGRTHEERALRDILNLLGTAPFYALDVGANAGSFAVRLGASAPKGSVIHAFEPNPQMRARLEHNLSLNDLKNIKVHDCAIADKEGKMDLFTPDINNLGQARLNEPFENGEKLTVEVRPITDFLPTGRKTKVDFMKVDIEGFEDRAILSLLDKEYKAHRPHLIFFEHTHKTLWQTDITARLLESGYKLSKEYGRNALFKKII